MSEVTIKPADPIVPGRPSWFVYRDGEFVARVWTSTDSAWQSVDSEGDESWHGEWRDVLGWFDLPADTPEPTPAPEVETVEVRFVAIVTDEANYTVTWPGDAEDALRDEVAASGKPARLSYITARVPLPAKPAEIVGEVAHVDE